MKNTETKILIDTILDFLEVETYNFKIKENGEFDIILNENFIIKLRFYKYGDQYMGYVTIQYNNEKLMSHRFTAFTYKNQIRHPFKLYSEFFDIFKCIKIFYFFQDKIIKECIQNKIKNINLSYRIQYADYNYDIIRISILNKKKSLFSIGFWKYNIETTKLCINNNNIYLKVFDLLNNPQKIQIYYIYDSILKHILMSQFKISSLNDEISNSLKFFKDVEKIDDVVGSKKIRAHKALYLIDNIKDDEKIYDILSI